MSADAGSATTERLPTEGQSPERRGRISPAKVLERFGLVAAWIVVIAVFGALRPDTFMTSANFSTILGSQAVLVVLTLGLTLALTTGDYDLSIGGTLSLSAMLIAVLNAKHGWPLGAAIAAALAAGAAVGAVNGMFVLVFGVDSFIVTLGTGTVLQGVVLWISDSTTISGVSDTLVNAVVGTSVLGIPIAFYYGLALCFVLWYVFEYTALGRRMLFVGRGRRVSRLSGIDVTRVRWGALVATGVISAFAGVLYAGTTGGADSTSGASFLLPAFAAAFLGATTIVPGRFNPWGTIVAVYFLVTGITGLTILGVQSYVQQLFYGGALVLAVALSQWPRRKEHRDAEAA
ncbi:MAG: transporter permease [Solirubrobacterales bacterium]|nr:transporter permease [Solirubrobacterales bacterium]